MIRSIRLLMFGAFSLVLSVPVTGQQEPSVPNVTGDPSAPPALAPTRQQPNNEATLNRLVSAADQLIPGEFSAASPVPAKLREAATALLETGATAAIEKLAQFREVDPALPPPPLLVAAMFFALNQLEAGHQVLERAAVEFPDYPGVYTALARLSINQGWWASSAALLAQLRQAIDAGSWTDEQKKHFELEYLDGLADTATGQQRFDEARRHLLQLRTALPDNASVSFRLADLDFRQNNSDDALENLTAARRHDAKLLPPELVLFQWSSRQGQVADAEKWIQAAAEKFPDERSVQLEYGRFLLERAQLEEAALWINRAAKNGAPLPIARFLQGQIDFLRPSYSVAEATFGELLIDNPNDLGVRNMRALCLIESSDPDRRQEALEIASANLRANPNNPQLASTLAWVLYRLGNVQQAKQILTQVTSLPNYPADTAYYLARMLVDDGKDENAAKELTRALESRGMFLYRIRAQLELETINQRLKQKPDSPERIPSPPSAPQDSDSSGTSSA